MNGTASYHLDPTKQIVSYQWDFNAADGLWWDTKQTPDAAEGAVGVTPTNPGYPDPTPDASRTYEITLKVTDNGATPQSDTDVTTAQVDTGNVPPVAVTNGPWAAVPSTCTNTAAEVNIPTCNAITFDASGSFDPDVDPTTPITTYEWDIDGDGLFNEGNGDDGWPQDPSWVVTKKIYPQPVSGTATLQVTDSGGLQGTATGQVFTVSFLYAQNYSTCWTTIGVPRTTQLHGLAVTFQNVGTGLAENVVMTLTSVPTNRTIVSGVTNAPLPLPLPGDLAGGASFTSACDALAKTAEIKTNVNTRVVPTGAWSWKAEFDFNGQHFIINNLPPVGP
jgi:hypothetical protein